MRRSSPFWASFILILALLSPIQAPAAAITGYRVVSEPFHDQSGLLKIVIRRFEQDGAARLLILDPNTLLTSVAKSADADTSRAAASDEITATPFAAALKLATSPPYKLQNQGAARSSRDISGMFLTTDLCPSKAPFEKAMYEELEKLPHGKSGAAPVAIAVSGLWMERHRGELAWLKREDQEGRLRITWVNHSNRHTYEPGKPLERNFLLSAGTDFVSEVLDAERMMLANGLAPSPFFRFPGLVSDGKLVNKLREMSLIPIGSDAWLAKGEKPRPGSFILVHGNGNEPKGIRKLEELLKKGKNIQLLPLAEAFVPGGSEPGYFTTTKPARGSQR